IHVTAFHGSIAVFQPSPDGSPNTHLGPTRHLNAANRYYVVRISYRIPRIRHDPYVYRIAGSDDLSGGSRGPVTGTGSRLFRLSHSKMCHWLPGERPTLQAFVDAEPKHPPRGLSKIHAQGFPIASTRVSYVVDPPASCANPPSTSPPPTNPATTTYLSG